MSHGLVNKVAARLGEFGCPYCHYTNFSIVLRGDLSSGGTGEVLAECQQCSMKFGLGRINAIAELHMRAEQELASQLCSCGESSRLERLCNLETEECQCVAACPKCGSQRIIAPGKAQTLVA